MKGGSERKSNNLHCVHGQEILGLNPRKQEKILIRDKEKHGKAEANKAGGARRAGSFWSLHQQHLLEQTEENTQFLLALTFPNLTTAFQPDIHIIP